MSETNRIPSGETETLDELSGYRLRMIQPRHGYRFSVDPLLLADFVPLRGGEEYACPRADQDKAQNISKGDAELIGGMRPAQ